MPTSYSDYYVTFGIIPRVVLPCVVNAGLRVTNIHSVGSTQATENNLFCNTFVNRPKRETKPSTQE